MFRTRLSVTTFWIWLLSMAQHGVQPLNPVTHKSNLFWFPTVSLNQTDAEQYCNNLGGHLAWIEDSDEQHWLSAQLALTDNVIYWYIGMIDHTDHGGSHNLSWTSGREVTFKNLAVFEPSNIAEKCVTIERKLDFQWADIFCNRVLAFVCKADLRTLSPRMDIFNHNKYFFADAQLSFPDAQHFCIAIGAHLVSISNKEELVWLLRKMNAHQWYTGFFRLVHDGTVANYWVNGNDVDFSGVSVEESSRAPCVVVDSSSEQWTPIECTAKKKFVCKMQEPGRKISPYIYWINDEMNQAAGGKKYCQGLGGNLAWMTSKDENNRMGVYLATHFPFHSNWLIGYRGIREDNTCWHGNFTCGYRNFRRMDSHMSEGLCTSISTAKYFQWELFHCDDTAPVVCKLHKENREIFFHKLNRYILATSPTQYKKAERFCQAYGGNLAWIEDEAEFHWLKDLLAARHPEINYWYIGLYDLVGYNAIDHYKWTSGHHGSYYNFAANEPSLTNESCVTMEKPLSYKWADVECSRKEAFVCKLPGKINKAVSQFGHY